MSMLKYAFKRVSKSGKLFLALIAGVLIATTFFSSVTLSADVTSRKALLEALENSPYDITINFGYQPTSENITDLANTINGSGIEGISSVERFTSLSYFEVVGVEVTTWQNHWIGIDNTSKVLEGSRLISGRYPTNQNETVIWAGSEDRSLFPINTSFSVNITFWNGTGVQSMAVPFTVVGIVDLTDQGIIAAFGSGGFGPFFQPESDVIYRNRNLFIADWNSTAAYLVDNPVNSYSGAFHTVLYVLIDRLQLINPFDLGTSIQTISTLLAQVENLGYQYGVYVFSPIISTLYSFQAQTVYLLAAMISSLHVGILQDKYSGYSLLKLY
jgi:hypothetical protein